MSDLDQCNRDVYERGEVVGVLDIPKEEAEALCKKKSEETGDRYDWHYSGGRVIVLCLAAGK